jgi:hypothetical protein
MKSQSYDTYSYNFLMIWHLYDVTFTVALSLSLLFFLLDNINIQYCMNLPWHGFQSLEINRVTQTRVSDDYYVHIVKENFTMENRHIINVS